MSISSKLKTALAFSKNLKTTGAFVQTSRKVELEICRYVSNKPNQIVVEFGIGHGNITKEILSRLDSSSKLYAFEVNAEFCAFVRQEIKDRRLIIINAGAEKINEHVSEKVNAILSSIPITFFSTELTDEILSKANEALLHDGSFSQILYSKFHKKTFQKHFDQVNIKTLWSFPLEYVHHCSSVK